MVVRQQAVWCMAADAFGGHVLPCSMHGAPVRFTPTSCHVLPAACAYATFILSPRPCT